MTAARSVLDGGAGDEAQRLSPEGYFFLHVLYGLSWGWRPVEWCNCVIECCGSDCVESSAGSREEVPARSPAMEVSDR
jgi:hypothetical protein